MQRLQGRPSIPARAIQELVENHIELHDDQARELSGYQDALELMKKSHKPLVYIAGKYKGISDEMDKLIADLVRLDYDVIGSQSEEEADIPF